MDNCSFSHSKHGSICKVTSMATVAATAKVVSTASDSDRRWQKVTSKAIVSAAATAKAIPAMMGDSSSDGKWEQQQ